MKSIKPGEGRKRIKQAPVFLWAKLLLKRLVGREIWLSTDIRVNTVSYGGWTVCPDFLTANSIVYSLGLGEDATFDFELARVKKLKVYGFDPTPNSAEWLSRQVRPEGFYFYPWAVTAQDGTVKISPRIKHDGGLSKDMFTVVDEAASSEHSIEVPAFSLPTIMTKLGHQSIDILKIDIEGAEFGVLSGLLASSVRPAQILVEFHHRFPGVGKTMTVNAIRDLRNAGYRIFHIASTGREMSFIRASGARFAQ
jgi:FkbM family methyltransferase